MIEPGRAVVNNSGLILYTAGAIKEDRGEKPYILVDGGMSDNPRPALYGSEHKLFNISENKKEEEKIYKRRLVIEIKKINFSRFWS